MNSGDQELRRAVENFAASVEPPPPPPGLQVGGRTRRPLGLSLLIAGALVVAVGVVVLWNLRPAPLVIVERVRLQGQLVSPRVFELPEANAVIVMAGEPNLADEIQVGFPRMVQPMPLTASLGFGLAGSIPFFSNGLRVAGISGGDSARDPDPTLPVYHVRLFRARWGAGPSGSALFEPGEEMNSVPLSELEAWGRPEQVATLRQALEANAIEAVPGLVIRSSPVGVDESYRFNIALGSALLEISFQGVELWEGQHRIHVRVLREGTEELLDAQLLIGGRRTTVLVAPLPVPGEALMITVTPLFGGGIDGVSDDLEKVWSDPNLTHPVSISRVSPVFPEEAKKQRLQGDVIIQAVIRKNGTLDGLVVLKMPEGGERLAGAAVDAVSKWRYEPAKIDGEPIDIYFTIVTHFVNK